MRDRWQALIDRFGALNTRERVLVLIALFAVAYQVGTLVVFDRQFEQIESLNAQIARDNNAILAVNQQINAAVTRVPDDPNQHLREEIAERRLTMQTLRADLQAAADDLISPRDMARLLEELLLQEPELALVRLNTLDSRPLLTDEPATTANATAAVDMRTGVLGVLHRHGFDLEFTGGYLTTLRYLETLESLPWRFFWDSVEYEVIDYPESVVRLRLHTLSLSEDWIGV